MESSINEKPNYIEFSDPRLVAIYDTVNPIASYEAFYIELAKSLRASSIIDFGCGTGLLTCELAKQGYRMTGVEPSGPMLELARKRSGGEDVTWIEGNVHQLGDVHADLVIMTGHVAQFFLADEQWKDVLEALRRALNPGGHMSFESRNPLIMPFANWPTEKSHKILNDPVEGRIEWWAKLKDTRGERVSYDIHYLFAESGEELVSANELRFRSEVGIKQALAGAGFTIENVFGDWDHRPATAETPEMIFVANRARSIG